MPDLSLCVWQPSFDQLRKFVANALVRRNKRSVVRENVLWERHVDFRGSRSSREVRHSSAFDGAAMVMPKLSARVRH